MSTLRLDALDAQRVAKASHAHSLHHGLQELRSKGIQRTDTYVCES